MDKQPMPKKEEKAKDNNSNAIVTDDTIATSSTATAKIDHPKL
jgi:hypothetical protein